MDLAYLSKFSDEELLAKGVTPDQLKLIQAKLSTHKENLLRLQEYKDLNRLEGFQPNPPQAKFFEAMQSPRYKILAATGGNQFGKTTLGVVAGLSMLFGEYLWSGVKLKFPHREPRMIRYLAKDFQNLAKTVVVPEVKKWWPKNRPVKIRNDPVTGVPAFFTDIKTGSVLQIMSAKQEPSAHAGWRGDAYICDEPFRRDVWNEIIPRLVVRNGKAIFVMTILKQHVWIDQDILHAFDEDGLPKTNIFVVHGTVYDNVGYGIETEKQVEDVMELYGDDEVSLQCRKWGIPEYLSGRICPTFSREKHLVPRFDVPIDWPIEIAIDVHPKKKQCVSFMGTDMNDQKWVVDEIEEYADPETLGHMIGKLCIRRGYTRIVNCIVDPLSKGIGMGAKKFDDSPEIITYFSVLQETLYLYGIYLRTSGKEKQMYKSGIPLVNRSLCGPNKLPSLFFFTDCPAHVKSVEQWAYKDDTEEPGEDGKDFCVNLCWLILIDTVWTPMIKAKRRVNSRTTFMAG